MSAMSAYLATVLRLRRSLRAISARGTPAAGRVRISLTSSRGTAVSSILPRRVRPKQPPGKTIRRGPRPRSRGRGPHDQTAQFLMHAQPNSRCTFGPLLIAHQQPTKLPCVLATTCCPPRRSRTPLEKGVEACIGEMSLGFFKEYGARAAVPIFSQGQARPRPCSKSRPQHGQWQPSQARPPHPIPRPACFPCLF